MQWLGRSLPRGRLFYAYYVIATVTVTYSGLFIARSPRPTQAVQQTHMLPCPPTRPPAPCGTSSLGTDLSQSFEVVADRLHHGMAQAVEVTVRVRDTAPQLVFCLLQNSVFTAELSAAGWQSKRMEWRDGTMTTMFPLIAPGEYHLSVFLKLLNYPEAACDGIGEDAAGKIIDRALNPTPIIVSVDNTVNIAAPLRICGIADFSKMDGQWMTLPVYRGSPGSFFRFGDCALPPYDDGMAAIHTTGRKPRWVRLLGDSNTRYLFSALPFVPTSLDTTWAFDRRQDHNAYRSVCIFGLDPPPPHSRNLQVTRKLCRVGLPGADPSDDFAVSWEWYTPIHEPSLPEYFLGASKNPYFTNSTVAGVFGSLYSPTATNKTVQTVQQLFWDRPDILNLAGGDHVIISFGSHAVQHNRNDVERYVDSLEQAVASLSPDTKLTITLTTMKTCRKFTAFQTGMFRNCHSENFRDKNEQLLRVLHTRGFLQSPGVQIGQLNVLDFWGTTEALENAMADKVHFTFGVYRLHAAVAIATVFPPA
ncbi:hypothetical protein P7C70_g4904, partial [Phenoliferia sp. Uapishka_3]